MEEEIRDKMKMEMEKEYKAKLEEELSKTAAYFESINQT